MNPVRLQKTNENYMTFETSMSVQSFNNLIKLSGV